MVKALYAYGVSNAKKWLSLVYDAIFFNSTVKKWENVGEISCPQNIVEATVLHDWSILDVYILDRAAGMSKMLVGAHYYKGLLKEQVLLL